MLREAYGEEWPIWPAVVRSACRGTWKRKAGALEASRCKSLTAFDEESDAKYR